MGLLIVNYHYIRDHKTGRGIHPVTALELTQQVDSLSKKYQFFSQLELKECSRRKTFPDGNYCLLTFDDGLKEQIQAFEILNNKGIPAIYFVPTMPIVTGEACSVHKFHYVMEKMGYPDFYSQLSKAFPKKWNNYWSVEIRNDALNKYIYDEEDWAYMKYFINYGLHVDEKSYFINKLFRSLVDNEKSFVKNLYMNTTEMREIANKDMLGSHCVTHKALGEMDTKQIEIELKNSKNSLYDITGKEIYSVSYPFGDERAVTSNVINKAQEFYRLGITTKRGLNRETEIYEQALSLKRVSTTDIKDGDYLDSNLSS